jgi:hypothetical protein
MVGVNGQEGEEDMKDEENVGRVDIAGFSSSFISSSPSCPFTPTMSYSFEKKATDFKLYDPALLSLALRV